MLRNIINYYLENVWRILRKATCIKVYRENKLLIKKRVSNGISRLQLKFSFNFHHVF